MNIQGPISASMFADGLRQHYGEVARALAAAPDAEPAGEGIEEHRPNRRDQYYEFLRQHAPAQASVYERGCLLGGEGAPSDRFDVVCVVDAAPRFDFHREGGGVSYSPLEGALSVARTEESLDPTTLTAALEAFATVPATPGEKPLAEGGAIEDYGDWPLKAIFAADGAPPDILLGALMRHYHQNPDTPPGRRPNLVHVAGRYAMFRASPKMGAWNRKVGVEVHVDPGAYYFSTAEPDLLAVAWTLMELQDRAAAARLIRYQHHELFSSLLRVAV